MTAPSTQPDHVPPMPLQWSIVIPAYNEERRLRPTLDATARFMAAQGWSHEIIVVDDGSTDGTARVIDAAAEQASVIRRISYQPNRGKGYAVRTGVRASRGAWVLMMDADQSVAITEITKFIPCLEQGGAIAIASRYLEDSRVPVRQPFYRVAWSRAGNRLIQRLLLPGVRDIYCGFKCFQRECAQTLFERQRLDGLAFDIEILALARHLAYSIQEIPVEWRDDRGSRLSPWREAYRGTRDLVRLKLRALRGWT